MDIHDLISDELTQNIISDLGVQDEPEEVQIALLTQLGENLFTAITADILEVLPQEVHKKFLDMMDSGNPEEFKSFIERYIPDFEEFTKNSVRKEITNIKQLADNSDI